MKAFVSLIFYILSAHRQILILSVEVQSVFINRRITNSNAFNRVATRVTAECAIKVKVKNFVTTFPQTLFSWNNRYMCEQQPIVPKFCISGVELGIMCQPCLKSKYREIPTRSDFACYKQCLVVYSYLQFLVM